MCNQLSNTELHYLTVIFLSITLVYPQNEEFFHSLLSKKRIRNCRRVGESGITVQHVLCYKTSLHICFSTNGAGK